MSTNEEPAVKPSKNKIRSYSRKDFLDGYVLPEQPLQDFEWNGVSAQYSYGHPKEWGSEDEVIDFGKELKLDKDHAYENYDAALSADNKLLAITSSGDEHILIYDVSSRSLCQILQGAGHLEFRPTADRSGEAESVSDVPGSDIQPAYTLVSSVADTRKGLRSSSQLVLWELDQNGRLLDEEEPIDPSAFATQALDAILPDLIAKHEWTKEFLDTSTLHADFAESLSRAADDHSRRHNTKFEGASLGSFNSVSFSTDGKLLLYHLHNDSTQHEMRDPEHLPHLIIHDLTTNRELHRLSGHTDAIMWSGISPDSTHAATVSYDGTMRMYCVRTGAFLWTTEDSGGQSWSGAFSPDSRHIVWTACSGRDVRMHEVATGKEVSRLSKVLTHWCRCVAWHPDGSQVALCVEGHALVWEPFSGPGGSIVQHLSLGDEERGWRGFVSVESVAWACEGRFLCVCVSDGSNIVYDMHYNTKQVYKRPFGRQVAWTNDSFYGAVKIGDAAFHVSVDGDAKVRYWRARVDQHPSWWDKKGEVPDTDAGVKKRVFPETGKYVKVTKPVERIE